MEFEQMHLPAKERTNIEITSIEVKKEDKALGGK